VTIAISFDFKNILNQSVSPPALSKVPAPSTSITALDPSQSDSPRDAKLPPAANPRYGNRCRTQERVTIRTRFVPSSSRSQKTCPHWMRTMRGNHRFIQNTAGRRSRLFRR